MQPFAGLHSSTTRPILTPKLEQRSFCSAQNPASFGVKLAYGVVFAENPSKEKAWNFSYHQEVSGFVSLELEIYCSMGFIVGNKILLSPSRLIPLRSAQNPHNCWVFETIYHPSCVLLGRPLHSKSCIKIVVVCRRIFLWKSVSTPKCQKLDKSSTKRTGTL